MELIENKLLDAALKYAELGYLIFPCLPGGKVPLTKNGYKGASNNLERIKHWWKKYPKANIGLATHGLIVIDVDGKNNSWPNNPDKTLELANGATSLTPGGGHHHIFKQPDGKNWRNTTSKIADKVDTRANGGYIIVPPSVIEDKEYSWVETLALEDSIDQLCEPSDWLINLLDLVKTPEYKKNNKSNNNANIIPDGQRNSTLASLAGTMRRVGMGSAEILGALTKTNDIRCKPPLTLEEVRNIANSICRYEPDNIAVAVTENHWAQDQNDKISETKENIVDPGPIPETLLKVPGFVSEVMEFCLETAPYPNTVLAFCGALALQSFLAGRKVRDTQDNRTNIFLLGLAHSASGKDWPRKINTRILYDIGIIHCLGDRFASGEGIQDALFVNPCMLFQTDEIDGILQGINKAKDARHESIMSSLLTLYSCSNSIYKMRAKAGQKSQESIDQPCLTVFGTAIPTHYYGALSERMLTNGFFARMLILESLKRKKGQETEIEDIPESIMDTAKWWRDFMPGTGNLSKWRPKPKVVNQTKDAKKLLAKARENAEEEYAKAEIKNDSVGTTVWGRVNEHTRKLALIYAISENYKNPVIGQTAVEWAMQFVTHQTKRMLFMAKGHVAANPFHADCLKFIQKLRDAPDQTLSHSVLLKRMKIDSQSFLKIINTLAQQGDIYVQQNKTAGRTGSSYRLIRGE